MPKSDTFKTLSLRMPETLHGEAKEAAKGRGVSLTEYMIRAIKDAVDNEILGSSANSADAAEYDLQVSFGLTGIGADDRAHRIADGLTNLAELSGGVNVEKRLVRITPMERRS